MQLQQADALYSRILFEREHWALSDVASTCELADCVKYGCLC